MQIEVVNATSADVNVRTVELPPGATVGDAVDAAGLDASPSALGVFGEVVDRAHVLEDGDRVDLLRPPLVDPMEARRQRAGVGGMPSLRARRPRLSRGAS